jgi:hypothetical protein
MPFDSDDDEGREREAHGSLSVGAIISLNRQPSNSRRKKQPADRPRKALRSLISFFKRGIRRLQAIFQSFAPLPPLWQAWRN